MREVAVVERDEVALQERGAEHPRPLVGVGFQVVVHRADVRDAGRTGSGGGWGGEVAWVDGEELAPDLEGQIVRGGAGERGLAEIFGRGYFLEERLHDVGGAVYVVARLSWERPQVSTCAAKGSH